MGIRSLALIVSGLAGLGLALPSVAIADEAALIACIQKYKDLGISPDAALSECKKSTLSGCVKRLMGRNFAATVIKENGSEYLMDLGSDENRWLEGKQWKALGCSAFTKGPYKRQSDNNSTFWSSQRSYEWFRQGWCSGNNIELEQPYTMQEAKLACEMGVAPEPKNKDALLPEDLTFEE